MQANSSVFSLFRIVNEYLWRKIKRGRNPGKNYLDYKASKWSYGKNDKQSESVN